jgi:hypothetical protein
MLIIISMDWMRTVKKKITTMPSMMLQNYYPSSHNLPKSDAALPTTVNVLSRMNGNPSMPPQPAHLDHDRLVFRITQDLNDAVVSTAVMSNAVVVPPVDNLMIPSAGHLLRDRIVMNNPTGKVIGYLVCLCHGITNVGLFYEF